MNALEMVCFARFLKIDNVEIVSDQTFAMPVMPAGGKCPIDIADACAPGGGCIIDIVGVFVRVSSPTETQTDRPRQTLRQID